MQDAFSYAPRARAGCATAPPLPPAPLLLLLDTLLVPAPPLDALLLDVLLVLAPVVAEVWTPPLPLLALELARIESALEEPHAEKAPRVNIVHAIAALPLGFVILKRA